MSKRFAWSLILIFGFGLLYHGFFTQGLPLYNCDIYYHKYNPWHEKTVYTHEKIGQVFRIPMQDWDAEDRPLNYLKFKFLVNSFGFRPFYWHFFHGLLFALYLGLMFGFSYYLNRSYRLSTVYVLLFCSFPPTLQAYATGSFPLQILSEMMTLAALFFFLSERLKPQNQASAKLSASVLCAWIGTRSKLSSLIILPVTLCYSLITRLKNPKRLLAYFCGLALVAGAINPVLKVLGFPIEDPYNHPKQGFGHLLKSFLWENPNFADHFQPTLWHNFRFLYLPLLLGIVLWLCNRKALPFNRKQKHGLLLLSLWSLIGSLLLTINPYGDLTPRYLVLVLPALSLLLLTIIGRVWSHGGWLGTAYKAIVIIGLGLSFANNGLRLAQCRGSIGGNFIASSNIYKHTEKTLKNALILGDVELAYHTKLNARNKDYWAPLGFTEDKQLQRLVDHNIFSGNVYKKPVAPGQGIKKLRKEEKISAMKISGMIPLGPDFQLSEQQLREKAQGFSGVYFVSRQNPAPVPYAQKLKHIATFEDSGPTVFDWLKKRILKSLKTHRPSDYLRLTHNEDFYRYHLFEYQA